MRSSLKAGRRLPSGRLCARAIGRISGIQVAVVAGPAWTRRGTNGLFRACTFWLPISVMLELQT